MPRTKLMKESYMKSDLRDLIEWKKIKLHYTNMELAKILHMHYNTVGKRISDGRWERPELIKLFEALEFTDEEIITVMRKQKYELRRIAV